MTIEELYKDVKYQLQVMCDVPVQNRNTLWELDFDRLVKEEKRLKNLLERDRERNE